MWVKLDEGAYMPEKAHDTDAGFDLRAKETCIVRAGQNVAFHTGVHIQLPKGTAGLIVSKSGLNVKHGITSTGLIDEGYTGDIVVNLYNSGTQDYLVTKGDKISQIVILHVVEMTNDSIWLTDEIEGGERGDNGFGSTGK